MPKLTGRAIVRGFIDLQVNGYVGVDFNDPETSLDELARSAQAMLDDGVEVALPTVITASPEAMIRCLENIARAREASEVAYQVFRGVHIEGPFLSPVDGYIGAHPKQHAASQNQALLERLLDAAGNLATIVTLAPEIDTGGRMTHQCHERGVVVAAGHSDASLTQLEECVDAGLSLFTHLGNGCPRLMDRHDNIIYRALRLKDRLRFSLIADGFHVPELLFRILLDWVPLENLLVVSDAISAAGLGPGSYRLGDRSVTIGEDRACRDASGEHFVGSASRMRDADCWLKDSLGLEEPIRQSLLVQNPARLLSL